MHDRYIMVPIDAVTSIYSASTVFDWLIHVVCGHHEWSPQTFVCLYKKMTGFRIKLAFNAAWWLGTVCISLYCSYQCIWVYKQEYER